MPTGRTVTELLHDRVERGAQGDFLNVPAAWRAESGADDPHNLMLERARRELLDPTVEQAESPTSEARTLVAAQSAEDV